MAWRSGSLSRSLMSAARASSLRSTPSLPRLRPPSLAAPRLQSRRFSLSTRTMGELGCTQSLLPLHSVVAAARLTSHLAVNARACCELSQGVEKMGDWRGCQASEDRTIRPYRT
ncbi:protein NONRESPONDING TO OXYLIPINS 2, mitochondrial-like isoform X2 [Telopea speciosissima]|uniref:protein NONRESPONDING TO OXYLIPINS 2, mitochondrial-like isoform X2 n=1 Tax=Telopea speciosissima TaxID=54955 RepID=UPI001CC7D0EC|nr:protein NONRESPONDING TO OXYLIPINS 2, mitochondrial-like isoform X2 [Telopea speciosissima]